MPPSQPTFGFPGNPYGEGYQQPFGGASYGGGYQPMQPKPQQFQDYVTTPFQPTPSPTVFLPSQTAPLSQVFVLYFANRICNNYCLGFMICLCMLWFCMHKHMS